MSLSFGPEYLGVIPSRPVKVVSVPSNTQAALSDDGVSVDVNGRVSFRVLYQGTYRITASDTNQTVSRVVVLTDSPNYDITSSRAYTDNIVAQMLVDVERNGEAASSLDVALPNSNAAVRTYNDVTSSALKIIGLGSSVGAGATLPDPDSQAPVAVLSSELRTSVNLLGNVQFATTNGSINGSIITDALGSSGTYAAAKAVAGGTPKIVVLAFGMNDGMPAQYHSGQTYLGAYTALRALIDLVLLDGADPIVLTSPHPHTGRTPWTNSVPPISYPATGTAVPALTKAASVKIADWSRTGVPVPASYRHARINEAMRQAATDAGVAVIDAEYYWFKAVAALGEDALFDPNEYAHPNLLGHQLSYGLAIRDFGQTLSRSTVRSGAALVKLPSVVKVKDSNTARTSTTTLSADQQLTFSVGPNQTWKIELDLHYTGGAGDIRVGLAMPDGSTGRIGTAGAGLGVGTLQWGSGVSTDYNNGSATTRSILLPTTYGLPIGTNGADAYALLSAVVRTGSSSGEIAVEFCQDTSSGEATTVYSNTVLRAEQVN